jgi:hypothetical protein
MFYSELFLNNMTGEFPAVEKVTLVLREKVSYKGTVHILLICLFKVIEFNSYIVHSDMSFLMPLLLHTPVQNEN